MKNALSLRSECAIVNRSSVILLSQKNYYGLNQFLDSICSIISCGPTCDIVRFYSYSTQKKYTEAEKYFNKAIGEGYTLILFDNVYIANLYLETGRKKDALLLLDKSIKRDQESILHSGGLYNKLLRLQLAAYYSMLNEKKRALEYLSELEKEGIFEYPVTLNTFPGFDNLRNDAEFKDIGSRIEARKASLIAQIKAMELRGEIDL